MKTINQRNYIQVADYLNRGFKQQEIADLVGISLKTVKLYKKRLKENPISDNELAKYRWLKKHWCFTGKYKKSRNIKTSDGYRIVRKGERGHLRTPYRADYIFR